MNILKILFILATISVTFIWAAENEDDEEYELDTLNATSNVKRSIGNLVGDNNRNNRFESKSGKSRPRNRKFRQRKRKYSKKNKKNENIKKPAIISTTTTITPVPTTESSKSNFIKPELVSEIQKQISDTDFPNIKSLRKESPDTQEWGHEQDISEARKNESIEINIEKTASKNPLFHSSPNNNVTYNQNIGTDFNGPDNNDLDQKLQDDQQIIDQIEEDIHSSSNVRLQSKNTPSPDKSESSTDSQKSHIRNENEQFSLDSIENVSKQVKDYNNNERIFYKNGPKVYDEHSLIEISRNKSVNQARSEKEGVENRSDTKQPSPKELDRESKKFEVNQESDLHYILSDLINSNNGNNHHDDRKVTSQSNVNQARSEKEGVENRPDTKQPRLKELDRESKKVEVNQESDLHYILSDLINSNNGNNHDDRKATSQSNVNQARSKKEGVENRSDAKQPSPKELDRESKKFQVNQESDLHYIFSDLINSNNGNNHHDDRKLTSQGNVNQARSEKKGVENRSDTKQPRPKELDRESKKVEVNQESDLQYIFSDLINSNNGNNHHDDRNQARSQKEGVENRSDAKQPSPKELDRESKMFEVNQESDLHYIFSDLISSNNANNHHDDRKGTSQSNVKPTIKEKHLEIESVSDSKISVPDSEINRYDSKFRNTDVEKEDTILDSKTGKIEPESNLISKPFPRTIVRSGTGDGDFKDDILEPIKVEIQYEIPTSSQKPESKEDKTVLNRYDTKAKKGENHFIDSNKSTPGSHVLSPKRQQETISNAIKTENILREYEFKYTTPKTKSTKADFVPEVIKRGPKRLNHNKNQSGESLKQEESEPNYREISENLEPTTKEGLGRKSGEDYFSTRRPIPTYSRGNNERRGHQVTKSIPNYRMRTETEKATVDPLLELAISELAEPEKQNDVLPKYGEIDQKKRPNSGEISRYIPESPQQTNSGKRIYTQLPSRKLRTEKRNQNTVYNESKKNKAIEPQSYPKLEADRPEGSQPLYPSLKPNKSELRPNRRFESRNPTVIRKGYENPRKEDNAKSFNSVFKQQRELTKSSPAYKREPQFRESGRKPINNELGYGPPKLNIQSRITETSHTSYVLNSIRETTTTDSSTVTETTTTGKSSLFKAFKDWW